MNNLNLLQYTAKTSGGVNVSMELQEISLLEIICNTDIGISNIILAIRNVIPHNKTNGFEQMFDILSLHHQIDEITEII